MKSMTNIVMDLSTAMIEIRETTEKDLKNVQRLWADGDVMRFVGFPDGLHQTDE